MSDKMIEPVVVVHNGRRYVLTASGVTRAVQGTDDTRRVDEYGVVIGPWSDSNKRATRLPWQ